ncbi:hypothetical protein LTR10_022098 [Elasticomyces elasticus]|uniref:DUF1765-domain-containing protein n=1 Tax=Exophiala sideris TaxID=1016849 RepID=A0ABR0IVG9_9EURO|nr:hypothetical protein LTR10_022098 [Elasticomyces elasticus]KAK5021462.1 hypothetical protein LTS07_010971 [Exophiala sideris]KAK5024514.1 hypothetical protein LTR13_010875 [Exophiala sideris]KAK5049594.1 hypothetical protein LTR69_010995 [Exophiala sideris]KAK5176611.1 hypothetical protein LTR44_010897 [Eurotiomycetes sp. CCFEE 6388]
MSAQVDGQVLPTPFIHVLSPLPSRTSLISSETLEEPLATAPPRSASYTYLSALETEPAITSIKRTFSENVLAIPPEPKNKMNDGVQSAGMVLFRKASKKAKKRMSSAIFSFSQDEEDPQPHENKSLDSGKGEQTRSLSRSVTGTIRTLARKSWAGSRSSSPNGKDGVTAGRKRSYSPRKGKDTATPDSTGDIEPTARSASPSPIREGDDLRGKDAGPENGDEQLSVSRRPALNVLQNTRRSETNLKRFSRTPSSTSLSSNELSRSRVSLTQVPPMPSPRSSDRLFALHGDLVKRKDPLWAAFRSIDGDFADFQARPSIQKSKVLRTILVPFLQKYAGHPSNKALRAEDLDRRTVVLNKWWTGLLEMLHGTHNQSISPAERPVFLEAASMIMSRPEWKMPESFTNSRQRSSIPRSKSTNSLESEEADFLVDTIHQNVRNMFIQNLLSQLAFVIDRLSWRAAPSSLVNFAGRTCAYAFFFCPGVADMLCRQWNLAAGTFSRVLNEFDIRFGDKLDLISNAMAGYFPQPVRSLSVVSQAALSRHLLPRRQGPPGLEKVHWWREVWLKRWNGRDTDLFFAFTKSYHLLVSDFLPGDISSKERAGIPGLVPVCAQILVVLEDTIYRQANHRRFANDDEAEGPYFDRDHPDAMAPLPVAIANADRLIAENRLVILLRDVLGDLDPDFAPFRKLFANSFEAVVRAATCKISMYNTDSCFVLCDFMEEVLPIMFRYHQIYNDIPALDWPFWLEVFKQMMQSQTTLTRIRLIAFLYNKWSILIFNEERKRDLVLGWLLDPQVFEDNFCHWSPMVRHFFYRLLCWRLARYDNGPVADLDIEILQTLAARLNKCWAHYQYLSAEAEMRGLPLPSSAPCTPAPSRVLLILRLDNQPLITPSRMAAETSLPAMVTQSSAYQNLSSALNSIPAADVPAQGSKKRWSLFRGLNMFGSTPGNSRPGEVTPPGSPDDGSPTASGDTLPGANGVIAVPKPASRPITPPHQACSFRFSLGEYRARPEHESPGRLTTPPQLPHIAENLLRARESSGNTSRANNDTIMRNRTREVRPAKPRAHELVTARYSGRALAEWAQVLVECRNFYGRRRQEGVPRDSLVETPSLGVENFRSPG